jgi:putative hydrolase
VRTPSIDPVSTSGPFGPDPSGDDNPFESMKFFLQDLSRMFAGGTAGNWDSAYQLAGAIANEGRSEGNVDPTERLAIEQLARVAELQIAEATGRPIGAPIRVEPLNRTQWARRFLDDERPLLERLSGSIGAALRAQLGEIEQGADTFGELGLPEIPGMSPDAILQQMMAMLGPMLLGMMAGSTAGHLAGRALGHYELPVPRPAEGPLTLVLSNVDDFASAWSLPTEGIRLWVCLSDVAHHQVLATPHVRQRLESLLDRYVSAFSEDPEQIERRLRELGIMDEIGSEPELEAMQRLAGEPDVLLGAMQSDEQLAIIPELDGLIAVIEGYVDHIMDRVADRLVPEHQRITEALRRRRVEAGPANRFVERLFGLGLSQATFDRGTAFIDGVVERSGTEALEQLWHRPENLPTPAEMDAPGLWLARVGIESTALELDDDIDFEIPDFPDL